jgi:hypothetical protein
VAKALNKLLKSDLVERRQKGLYAGKRRPEEAPAPAPEKPRRIAKTTEPKLVPSVALSVVTVELLVEGERSQIDVGRVLGKIREDKAILDARVRKVAEADQSKLSVRFAFANEE